MQPPSELPANQYWSLSEGVLNCLLDYDRTKAFEAVIENIVAEGDVVVDMGSGTGILAMMAARRGARTVYAVEYDDNNITNLRRTVEMNGFDGVIEVIHGDVTSVDLPGPVDVIIGEMIATGLIEELQVPAMNNMLRFARPGVKVLLKRYDTYVDLVYNDDTFYGFKFHVVKYEYPGDDWLRCEPRSNRVRLCSVDFTQVIEDLQVARTMTLRATAPGTINGLRISSETTFADGTRFGASSAYSYPIIMPVEALMVEEGDLVKVSVSYRLCEGMDGFTYSVAPVRA